MATTKVAISLDSKLLERLDRLVSQRVFRNRSQAVQDAIRDKLDRLAHCAWPRCAKLDVGAEQELADKGLANDATEWPEYQEATLCGLISTRRWAESRLGSARLGDPSRSFQRALGDRDRHGDHK